MSLNSQNLVKVVSFEQFKSEHLPKILYSLWFGAQPHKQFENLKYQYLFITELDNNIAFGFAVTKINTHTDEITLRAHYLSYSNFKELIEEGLIVIVSGDISPTLIKLDN